MQRDVHDLPAAEATLRQAAQVAARARDDLGAAEAWTQLVFVIGYLGERHADALALRLAAEGAVERAGGGALPRAKLLATLARILNEQGKCAEALDLVERALGALDGTGVPDPVFPIALADARAMVLVKLERYDEAERVYAAVVEGFEELLGPDHPTLASTLSNAARVFNEQGKGQQALAYLERALAIQERTLGPEHPLVASTLVNLGRTFRGQRRYPDAIARLERGLATQEKVLGPNSLVVASTLTTLADTSLELGKPARALSLAERALAIYAAKDKGVHPANHAQTRFIVARALWLTRGDRRRAVDLAKQTRDTYADWNGEFMKEELHRVEGWLAARHVW